MYSIIELQKDFDELSIVRRRQLSTIQNMVNDEATDYKREQLIRYWIITIYNICDQHVKMYCQNLYRHAKENNDERYDFKALWLLSKNQSVVYSNTENFIALNNLNRISDYYLTDAYLNTEVLKKGNFSFKRLKYLCSWVLQINLDIQSYATFCKTLLDDRNDAAHGDDIDILEVADYIQWNNQCTELLGIIADEIINKFQPE